MLSLLNHFVSLGKTYTNALPNNTWLPLSFKFL